MVKIHVIISGWVQGVSYRSWTLITAQSLGLSGWVRNLFNGRVEAVFVGKKEKVEKMIELLYQGPPASSVDKIEVVKKEETQFDPFGGRFSIERQGLT